MKNLCNICHVRHKDYTCDKHGTIFPVGTELCVPCRFWGEFHWIETAPRDDLILAVNYSWLPNGKVLLSHVYKARLSGDTTPLGKFLKDSKVKIDPRLLPTGDRVPLLSTSCYDYLMEKYALHLAGEHPTWYPDNWIVGF